MVASLKNSGGCAGGQMCRNVPMRLYHKAYRHKRKALYSKQGTDKRKITGNAIHFRSVAPQYTPQRFAPVARHIMRCACSCARGALLKATDCTVATRIVSKTRTVRIIVTLRRIPVPTDAVEELYILHILSECL